VTAHVTLVVLFVLAGVRTAASHLLIGNLPTPGNNHIVDVDGIVPRPEDPLLNPEKPPFVDEGFHKPFHMPDGKPGDASETLIGNPGVLAEEIGLAENCV
jgi:hypothetical protein